MSVAAPLLYRGRTRAGWIVIGVVTGGFALLAFWASLTLSGSLGPNVVVFVLALLYGWVADGALRVATAKKAYVGVEYRARYRRRRLLMALGVSGIVAFFVILDVIVRS